MRFIGLIKDPYDILAQALVFALPIALFIHFAFELIKAIIKERRNKNDSK